MTSTWSCQTELALQYVEAPRWPGTLVRMRSTVGGPYQGPRLLVSGRLPSPRWDLSEAHQRVALSGGLFSFCRLVCIAGAQPKNFFLKVCPFGRISAGSSEGLATAFCSLTALATLQVGVSLQ
jgi:hypothetical protein